jgi:two-component system sensor kinase FixL
VDVNAAIDDVLRLLASEMRQRRIHVHFVRDGAAVQALGDAVQLRQVLINLLINAAEAITAGGKPDGEIHVECRRLPEGRVSILVRDNGIGVKESEIEQMFEHFVSSKPQGLGMGLAISRSIVAAHGGLIWATRNDGRGLTLNVELPIAEQDASLSARQDGRVASMH